MVTKSPTMPITSSELGTLWMSYQTKKMMATMLEYFIEKSQDHEAKSILIKYYNIANSSINEIEGIFNREGAVIPISFDHHDVRKDAPLLFDNMFDIMFLIAKAKISLGMSAVNSSMSYRKDIRDLYKRDLIDSQQIYDECTDYLLNKGVLARPPYVDMPTEAEFVQDKSYMKGIKLFGDKRSLNTVEVAYIFQSIESNIMGMQLMTGFAQVAKEKDVRDYFIKGKELAKEIVTDLSQVLVQSDIQPPSTWAGNATNSKNAPFSDKIMLYCTGLLSSFALGSNALGTSFSMRSDLPAKLAIIMKDTFQYASEGSQLMIKYKWLEEPPQMEDRNQLTKS
jgi:hypothetical protein